MASLTITAGPMGGQTLPLTGEMTIGRNPSLSQLTLSDGKISQTHARLSPGAGGTWTIRDLGSTNGTFILQAGGQRRRLNPNESYALRDGDQLEVGDTRLVFSARGAAAPAAAPVATAAAAAAAPVASAPRPRPVPLLPIAALGIGGLLLLAVLVPLLMSGGLGGGTATPTAAATQAAVATVAATKPAGGTPGATAPVAAVASPAAAGTAATGASCTPQDGLARIRESTVRVFAFDAGGQLKGTGTGFVLTTSGYIMTNRHVVLDEATLAPYARFVVRTGRGAQEYLATITNVHSVADLAVIKTDTLPSMKPVAWARSDTLRPGDDALATGFGLASNPTIQDYNPTNTAGIVSDATRIIDGTEYIQHSAPINPGNSGGPLINRCGEVIGVNSAAPVTQAQIVGADAKGKVQRLPAAAVVPVPGVYLAISSNVAKLFAEGSVPGLRQ